MKNRYAYSTYKKIFVDHKDGRMFLLDVPKYVNYLDERGYEASAVYKKVELIAADEKNKSRHPWWLSG